MAREGKIRKWHAKVLFTVVWNCSWEKVLRSGMHNLSAIPPHLAGNLVQSQGGGHHHLVQGVQAADLPVAVPLLVLLLLT